MKCNICSSQRNTTMMVKDGTNIVMCDNCSLVYSAEQPGSKELSKLYNSGDYSPVSYYTKTRRSDGKVFRFLLSKAEKYIKPGKLLDVGCNIGTFMDIAVSSNWDVAGIEINKSAVEICKKKHKKVICGYMEKNTFRQKNFDAVNLGDVIEHFTEPGKMLDIISMILKPGGILIISTPDIGRWSARKFQVKPGEHLFYFSKKTIANMLDKHGFEVLDIGNYSPYKNISAFSESSTFKNSGAGRIFRVFGKFGDIVVKIPLGEELYVIARKK